MKMSVKLMFGTAVLSLSLVVAAVPGFASTSHHKVSGGWSETGGYFINVPSGFVGTLDSSSPDKHEGKRLSQEITGSGDYRYAAYGETTWKDTYHYTTARMEDNKDNVRSTSGRQWGTGYTTAQSPWYTPKLFEWTQARTYWGT
ncbi:hypothetical protein [Paenibacillus apiarius]|uniref:Bacteriocin n=1 Tax=Paenibacillus apiarius TaxID=46240 RepID=A0ABT4DRM2_9BACL|nr:hypothetical protein [Paenibacillus apiarius]MCY9515265.1 hypothetical protein [Paenibacillus apiarius]MCY9520014.1 hypothetical protein [Paenibacillus apiarius]MCY9554363.1 hypothetical protein [Paenibacillus apiarius]MCY9558154.1 hypothetical protein [Paenibacillus apiarius]MCY9684949.1 hypothetical protein [Paenibacillus apiarius]